MQLLQLATLAKGGCKCKKNSHQEKCKKISLLTSFLFDLNLLYTTIAFRETESYQNYGSLVTGIAIFTSQFYELFLYLTSFQGQKSAILGSKFCVFGGKKPQKCNFCNLQFSGSLRKIGLGF